jgi:5'-3' exonuclease
MGIISIRHLGAEADDLLYHASRILDDKNIIIVTSDKDLYQACTKDGNVKVLKGDELISTKEIEKYIGLPFTQLGEWRAIQGDKSDNIPGIPGIGEVTATKLMSQFGDIIGLCNAAAGISPKKVLLSPKIASKVCAFGMHALVVNIVVSKLYIDRVGARIALVTNLYPFPTVNVAILKKFFMSRAFTSLMVSNLFANIRKFRPPKIRRDVRFPVNIGRRFPID